MKDLDPKLIIWGAGAAIALIVLAFAIAAGGKPTSFKTSEAGVEWEVEYPTEAARPAMVVPTLMLPLPSSDPVTIRFINKCDAILETAIYYENIQGDWVVGENMLFQDDMKEVATTKNDSFYYHGHALFGGAPKWEGNAQHLILSDNKTYGFYLQQMVGKKNPYDFSWNCQ